MEVVLLLGLIASITLNSYIFWRISHSYSTLGLEESDELVQFLSPPIELIHDEPLPTVQKAVVLDPTPEPNECYCAWLNRKEEPRVASVSSIRPSIAAGPLERPSGFV